MDLPHPLLHPPNHLLLHIDLRHLDLHHLRHLLDEVRDHNLSQSLLLVHLLLTLGSSRPELTKSFLRLNLHHHHLSPHPQQLLD